MTNYQSVKLDKAMYKTGESFLSQLEKMDNSKGYQGTELAGLDAFERQLKRFDIKVSGAGSDKIEKFFKTSDSALLFPAYLASAVTQGMTNFDVLSKIIASKTNIDSLDYRSIASLPTEDEKELKIVMEGGFIPQTTISLQDHLVHLRKRGRMLVSSYEAIRFQRLDLFAVTLKHIGNYIAKSQLQDAVDVLMNGDGNNNAAEAFTCKTPGTLTYEDLISLWERFEEFEMNIILASPDMATKILSLPEMLKPGTALNFADTNQFMTPFGAAMLKSNAVPAGTIVALDKNCALEMVTAGDVNVDYDKLIDCQMERVAITSISGFAKVFPDAVKVLKLR